MGVQVIPDAVYAMGYENNGLMLLSPMALITVGIFIWIQRARNRKLIEKTNPWKHTLIYLSRASSSKI